MSKARKWKKSANSRKSKDQAATHCYVVTRTRIIVEQATIEVPSGALEFSEPTVLEALATSQGLWNRRQLSKREVNGITQRLKLRRV